MKYYILTFLVSFSLSLFSQETIETKFLIPDGYERVIINKFHKWVISQPLKDNNKVFYTNGDEKINSNYNGDTIWAAVFDYDLGTHKYHQCARYKSWWVDATRTLFGVKHRYYSF